ncbi:acyl-CoA thioesterase [Dactylosporangium sp. CS-033363]|uniref:acyl-CoA thioesterase n=1 Tax=Dactylosporangium sp. CS-033363 TaxID=3239935 RepID=UPI003D8CA443
MSEHTVRPPSRATSYSRVTLSRIMTAVDVNLYGTVHGGVIMKFIDDVAGAAAARHSGGTAVTASIDEIAFIEPLRVGDLVHAFAQVNWTGTSSMEVGVRLDAERWDQVSEAAPLVVATAYLVFVAIDADGKPRPVPAVAPDSPENEGRWHEAEIRRAHRLARREAIQQHRSTR